MINLSETGEREAVCAEVSLLSPKVPGRHGGHSTHRYMVPGRHGGHSTPYVIPGLYSLVHPVVYPGGIAWYTRGIPG